MANLHVQPKRKNYLWIWVLIIILIAAAAIYYYVNYYNKGTNRGPDNTLQTTPASKLHFAQASIDKPAPAGAILQFYF